MMLRFIFSMCCFVLFTANTYAQGFVIDSMKYGPDTVYITPDETAVFPGGKHKILEFIDLKFGALTDGYGEMGGVKGGSMDVSFVIETTGRIKYVFVDKGISASYDEDMTRALMTMPKWQPAVVNGKKVRSLQKIHYNLNFDRQ